MSHAGRKMCSAALAAAVAGVLAGCGGSEAGRISASIKRAIEASKQEGKAEAAICDALSVYSSRPAGSIPDLLRAYANQARLTSNVGGLEEAADDIRDTQLAGDVLSKLGCR